ncbi:CBF/Mak21 family-domain-containing protein [Multifurca ochricompacta]|uniref:CBF/Mak21 family-domain-containing protein n=1 Tax=Multifurca ochricompacta TaxID=376703 RepID=A0AAD4QJK4_9AGAM|nr:CBF/Mak21 family-domain-containing protein [Multifurca ochricompacta]
MPSTILTKNKPEDHGTSTSSTSKSKPKLLVPVAPDWYNHLPSLPSSPQPLPSPSQIAAFFDRASSLHASDLSNFSALPHAAGNSASDQAFLRNILSGGTLSDRLSALTLISQGAPLHNIRALEALKNWAEKGRGGLSASQDGEKGKGKAAGREERLKAARAIMDWWVGGGAPKRKLKYFRDQPLLHPDVTDQHLVIWYFEDWLKKYFFSYLQILEGFSLDPLPYVRTQSLTLIATLLRSSPEQEQNLLRLLVNKLGDTESAICSRTSYHLLQVLQEHPAMKTVIIRETTALIMRPTPPSSLSVSGHTKPNTHIRFSESSKSVPVLEKKSVWHAHARYYAAITFNQIVLSTSEEGRAAARALIDVYFQLFRQVVGERQHEPAEDAASAREELKDKRKDKDKKPKAKKAKGKEIRGAAGFAEVQDSNAKLVGAILTGVNRALPYARFGGAGVELDKHMNTVFLLVHTSTFNISLRALTLIQQISASSPTSSPVVSRYYRALYATLLDSRLYTTRNQALFLNLLFRSLKADTEKSRVMAFVKRFCQILVSGFGGSEFVAGGLWLLGELFNLYPGLRILINNAPVSAANGEEYDPHKREPLYAHAQSSVLWELTTLVHHIHPTIALLARQLLSHEPLTSSPDLTLYTLTHFLDRFVYKNPKKAVARGASAMQPTVTGGADGVRRVRADVQEVPLNVDEWWRRGEGTVPADQVFFQRYFTQKHAKEQARATKVEKRKGAKHGGSDEESDDEGEEVDNEEGSDPEEAEIWKVMKASMPGGDDDADLDDNDDDDTPAEGSVLGSESDDVPSDVQNQNVRPDDISDLDDGEFSLAESSDADDLFDLDAEVPVDLVDLDEEISSAEEWTGFTAVAGERKKRRRKGEELEETRARRKKLRSLPTFASYEDYAKMIENGPEDNL